MNPLEFLDLARRLSSDEQESAARTAVSRSYYAAFLLLRDRLVTPGGSPPRDTSVHQWVMLRAWHTDPEIGERLRALRRQRNLADYELRSPIRRSDALHAIELATVIVSVFPPRN